MNTVRLTHGQLDRILVSFDRRTRVLALWEAMAREGDTQTAAWARLDNVQRFEFIGVAFDATEVPAL